MNYRFANSGRSDASGYQTPAAVRWSGPYVGLHGGLASGTADIYNGTSSLDLRDGFGGFQSGYNWQFSNWVLGAETDISLGSIEKSDGAGAIKIDMMTSVRGRIGYAMGPLLVFGTGGLAALHAETALGVPATDRYDRFHLGWTAGAGVEYAFARRWSMKLDYLHSDYGTLTDRVLFVSVEDKLTVDTVRLGINYRGSALDLLSGR